MKKVISIGEALIDFIPNQKGCELKGVTSFERVVGGAPANVSAVVAKLGGKSNLKYSCSSCPWQLLKFLVKLYCEFDEKLKEKESK